MYTQIAMEMNTHNAINGLVGSNYTNAIIDVNNPLHFENDAYVYRLSSKVFHKSTIDKEALKMSQKEAQDYIISYKKSPDLHTQYNLEDGGNGRVETTHVFKYHGGEYKHAVGVMQFKGKFRELNDRFKIADDHITRIIDNRVMHNMQLSMTSTCGIYENDTNAAECDKYMPRNALKRPYYALEGQIEDNLLVIDLFIENNMLVPTAFKLLGIEKVSIPALASGTTVANMSVYDSVTIMNFDKTWSEEQELMVDAIMSGLLNGSESEVPSETRVVVAMVQVMLVKGGLPRGPANLLETIINQRMDLQAILRAATISIQLAMKIYQEQGRYLTSNALIDLWKFMILMSHSSFEFNREITEDIICGPLCDGVSIAVLAAQMLATYMDKEGQISIFTWLSYFLNRVRILNGAGLLCPRKLRNVGIGINTINDISTQLLSLISYPDIMCSHTCRCIDKQYGDELEELRQDNLKRNKYNWKGYGTVDWQTTVSHVWGQKVLLQWDIMNTLVKNNIMKPEETWIDIYQSHFDAQMCNLEYQGSKVLVVDAMIMFWNMATAFSPIIYISDWSCRGWTYSEPLFTTHVSFLFQNNLRYSEQQVLEMRDWWYANHNVWGNNVVGSIYRKSLQERAWRKEEDYAKAVMICMGQQDPKAIIENAFNSLHEISTWYTVGTHKMEDALTTYFFRDLNVCWIPSFDNKPDIPDDAILLIEPVKLGNNGECIMNALVTRATNTLKHCNQMINRLQNIDRVHSYILAVATREAMRLIACEEANEAGICHILGSFDLPKGLVGVNFEYATITCGTCGI